MTSRHTHLHINVQRTMSRAHVTADMEKAFGLGADTIGMCELETTFHHLEFERCAKKYGYEYRLWGSGAAGALGLAVNKKYGFIASSKSTFATFGKHGLSPNRYVNRIRVRRHIDGALVMVNEHHAWSSGWTGSKAMDALRRARWYIGMAVVRSVNRNGTNSNDLVIGGGDINRPPSTFKNGIPLATMLSKKDMKSTGYVHTDATHGKTTFDYVWWLSKRHVAKVAKWSTPSFKSDHDGILATLEW